MMDEIAQPDVYQSNYKVKFPDFHTMAWILGSSKFICDDLNSILKQMMFLSRIADHELSAREIVGIWHDIVRFDDATTYAMRFSETITLLVKDDNLFLQKVLAADIAYLLIE